MITLGKSLRPTAAITALAALDAGCWSWCQDDRDALAHLGRADFATLVTALAALVLQVSLTWLLLLTVLVVLEPLAGRDLTSYAGCPAALRAALLACCGLAAVGMLAGPAQAAPVSQSPAPDAPVSQLLDGLPLPDRTLGGIAPPVSSHTSTGTVLVRRGDTLWGIASRHLPGSADDAQVQRAADALYTSNRSQVGPDPDLIRPGQRLRLPTTPHQEDHR